MKKKIFGVEISKELVFVIIILVIISALASYKNILKHNWTPPETVIGTWVGQAELSETSENEEFPNQFKAYCDFKISINEDASVTGKIGNAELVDCIIKKNRAGFERRIGLGTDYLIIGNLKNAFVETDLRTEREIRLTFDLVDGEFQNGRLKESGWENNHAFAKGITLTLQEE